MLRRHEPSESYLKNREQAINELRDISYICKNSTLMDENGKKRQGDILFAIQDETGLTIAQYNEQLAQFNLKLEIYSRILMVNKIPNKSEIDSDTIMIYRTKYDSIAFWVKGDEICNKNLTNELVKQVIRTYSANLPLDLQNIA